MGLRLVYNAADHHPRTDRPTEPLADGSVPAFRALYDAHFSFVWRCARALGVPERAADEVVHDTFVAAYQCLAAGKAPDAEAPARVRSWLYGLLRCQAGACLRAERVRKQRVSMTLTIDESLGATLPSPEELEGLRDELQLMWRLLLQLDVPQREVLVLAEIEELALPEIAQTLGIQLRVAHSRLRAARRQFEHALGRLADSPDGRRRGGDL